MKFRIAKRNDALRASEIREILKLTTRPEVISFAGGLPAPETFPADELATVTTELLRDNPAGALQYSTTEGVPALRRAIAERMNLTMNTRFCADDILITSGSQQGLDLVGRLLLDPGDVILCESPTYLGAIQAFRAFQARFLEIETDDDGMISQAVEAAIIQETNIKMIYVVPDFQNPSGRCWSLERRQAVIDLAVCHHIPIVEDSPYSALRFKGTAIPSLAALDTDGVVMHLGTFSKILCPGMRLGWTAAAPELREKLVLLKQGADLHTSTLGQMQLAAYLEKYGIDNNIERIRELYRERREVMLAEMNRCFPAAVKYTRPEGGLFLWAVLPERLNARDLLVECLKVDVAFVPGGPFFPNGGHENTMRLNFSAMPPDRIREGIKRIGKVLKRMLTPATTSLAATSVPTTSQMVG